jgi:unsaturated chondroitin disaccharide hydrolase
MTGFAEQLEFITERPFDDFGGTANREAIEDWMVEAARATCDFYIDHGTASDGVPYWDTGAPGLVPLGDWAGRPANPFNDYEPVDSSAAAIAAQGLIRLGRALAARGEDGGRYEQAGLGVLAVLLDDAGPYLSTSNAHQGLLLHSIYHRPNGWDYVPEGSRIPRGESSQWGDYHLREAALLVRRIARGEPYLTFFGPTRS